MERAIIDSDYIETDSINEIIKRHDFKENKNLLLYLEKNFDDTIDYVVYDTSNMLEMSDNPDIDEFNSTVDENGLDREEFEIDRINFVR